MTNWLHLLHGDPLPWLLEAENPAVRYWTLRDILDRPAAPDVQAARAALAEQPLVQEIFALQQDGPYDFAGEHKRWLTFGVPRGWDLLSALKALAAHGCAGDERFAPLLDLLLQRQDAAGRWLCGSPSQTWPIEKRNRPSKWVTLDALRVLKKL